MEAGSQDAQADGKGLEKLMDAYLKSKGFYRKKVAKDGSCLFRAVAEQVLHCQSRHGEVRTACVNYLKSNRAKYEAFIEGDFDEYLERLKDPQNWVGEVEISALALIYKHDFIIFQEPGKLPVNITENSFSDKVRLCFLNGNHYDSVYPTEFISDAAICQSILYELLYKKVYAVDGSAVDTLLKNCTDATEGREGECHSSEESDLEEEDDFWPNESTGSASMNNTRALNNPPQKTSGKAHPLESLSQRVRKSLSPSVYRNVEYDVWLRTQRAQQKRDFCIAAGMQYAAGDKCKVRLDNTGRIYSAYVQEVSPNNGPVMVFIEELGQKHSVPLWNLRPPVDDPLAWNTVVEKGRKQSLANGNSPRSDWEVRTRKPVKQPAATSYTSRGAMQNRMQRQNPWPPQNAADEQPLGRNLYPTPRRGDPRAGSALQQDPPRLSEDTRSAKEEEEEEQAREKSLRSEKSFPALGMQSVPQAGASDGENGKKLGSQNSETPRRAGSQVNERRVSRKKVELQDHARDGDRKTLSPKTGARGERTRSLPTATSSSKLPAPVSAPDQTGPPVFDKSPSAGPHTPPPTQLPSVPGPPVVSASRLSSGPAPTSRFPARTAQAARSVATSQQLEAPGPASSSSTQTVQAAKSLVSAAASATATSQPSQRLASGTPTRPCPAPGSTPAALPPQLPAAAKSSPAQPSEPAVLVDTSSVQTSHTNVLAALSSGLPSPVLPPAMSPPARSLPATSASDLSQPIQSTAESVAQSTSALTQPAQTVARSTTALAQPAQSAAPSTTALAQPAQSAAPSATALAQPAQSAAPSATALAQPAQSAAPSATALAQPTQLSGFSHATTPGGPSQVALRPSAYASTLQPSFSPHVIPTPPPSKGPAAPVSFSSLPLEHPPYEVTTSCPMGTMPQVRVSPGPASVPLLAEHLAHPHAPSPVSQTPVPHHQILSPYQDILYPGFPLSEKDGTSFIPQFSILPGGEDLPRDRSILKFFFNLGVKAYTNPFWLPSSYICPLQQAYLNSMQSKPSASPYMAPWVPEALAPVLTGNPVAGGPVPMQEGYGQVPLGSVGGRAVAQFDPMHCSVHPNTGTGVEVGGPGLGSEGRPSMGYSSQSPMQLPPQVGGAPWARQGAYPGAYPPPPQGQPPPLPPQFAAQFVRPSLYGAVSQDYAVHRMPGGIDGRLDKAAAKEPAGHKVVSVSGSERPSLSAPTSESDQAEEAVATPEMDSSAQAAVPTRRILSPGRSCVAAVGDDGTAKVAGPQETLRERSEMEEPVVGLGPRESVKTAYVTYGFREHYEEEGEVNEAALRNGKSYYSSSYRPRRGYDDRQGFRERGWRGGGRMPYRGRRGQDNRREYVYRERKPGDSYPGASDKGQIGKGRSRPYNQYQ